MKNIYLAAAFICLLNTVKAQKQRNEFYAGVEIYIPASKPFITNETTGYTLTAKGEHFFSKNISATISAGFSYFTGTVIFWDNKRISNFILVPVNIGGKYYFNKAYISLEFGPAISLSEYANTNLSIAPSAGYLIGRFDAGIKFFSVPQLPAAADRNFLQKGGYSYAGFRVAYRLNK